MGGFVWWFWGFEGLGFGAWGGVCAGEGFLRGRFRICTVTAHSDYDV